MPIFIFVGYLKMVIAIDFSQGYDSDVDREKRMDYSTKIYNSPIKDKEGIPPHLQEQKEIAK